MNGNGPSPYSDTREDEFSPESKGSAFSDQGLVTELEAITRTQANALSYLRKQNVEPAPHFEDRLTKQVDLIEAAMVAGSKEKYRWTNGDYSSSEYATSATPSSDPKERRSGEVVNHEIILAEHIREQLAYDPEQPKVILDIGGGAGVSWDRLARQFEAEIALGQVVFVVSNLISIPETFPEEWSDQRNAYEPINPHEEKLVHMISSTFADLPDAEITLPTGVTISLRGHTALTHESRSLTAWSKVPELDILKASEVMSPHGIYFVKSADTYQLHSAEPLSASEDKDRQEGIRKAHVALQTTLGLKLEHYQSGVNSSVWMAFRSPNRHE